MSSKARHFPASAEEQRFARHAVDALRWVERSVFFLIGVLLFAVALILLVRSVGFLAPLMVAGRTAMISASENFLAVILFVLILVELAYTVMLSLRGAELSAEPFLIVGLIAVVRRILVITVGEVAPNQAVPPGAFPPGGTELLILTAVAMAFVLALWLLRRPYARSTRWLKH
jgi:uncharacterized membrane protein (DUF373 family)